MCGWGEQEIGPDVAAEVVLGHVPLVPAVVEHDNRRACSFERFQILLLLRVELPLELLYLPLHAPTPCAIHS